jgi:hypothetical protein
MRSLFRSLLAFFTRGMATVDPNQSASSPVPTDVTLHVPGMY